MNLLVVESPGKIATIEKYLGENYKVVATNGHLRDLRENNGFNSKTFEPYWELNAKKRGKNRKPDTKLVEAKISEIRALAKEADNIYIASDPDREGEAISWHVWDLIDAKYHNKCKRITFNEITKEAITEAIKNPRDIDMNQVHSQWARRILDRFIGYDLSQLVQRKLCGVSAGRVQSVALLLIVERAKKVEAFVPDHWWTIDTVLNNNCTIWLREDHEFDGITKKKIASSKDQYLFGSEADATKICDEIKKLGNSYELYKIEPEKEKVGQTVKPFTTDALYIKAINNFNWDSKRAKDTASDLYQMGITTYPRTDNIKLSDSFIAVTREYIKKVYGEKYVGSKNLSFSNGPLVQGAHESIRPVDINLTPEMFEAQLKAAGDKKKNADYAKMYKLIWTQTISSLMAPPITKQTKYRFRIGEEGKKVFKFYTSNIVTVFDGYEIITHYNNKEKVSLQHLKEGDRLTATKGPEVKHHETEPEPYFNESSLIKKLKDEGIGRPSTYADMVKINGERDYVIPKEELPKGKEKELRPTEKGKEIIEKLCEYFPKYISKEFTKNMELDLEGISDGKVTYVDYLRNLHDEFRATLKETKEQLKKAPERVVEGRKCPKCGKDLYYKQGRFGEFIGCSGWSTGKDKGCDYKEALKPAPNSFKELDEACPLCGSKLQEVINNTKGTSFIGCSGYQKGCRYIKPKTVGRKCPKCGKELIYCSRGKSNFIGCEGYKKDKTGCTYIEKLPKEEKTKNSKN